MHDTFVSFVADAGPSDFQGLHPLSPPSAHANCHQTPSPSDFPSPSGARQVSPSHLQQASSLQNIINYNPQDLVILGTEYNPQNLDNAVGHPPSVEPSPYFNISLIELEQIELSADMMNMSLEQKATTVQENVLQSLLSVEPWPNLNISLMDLEQIQLSTDMMNMSLEQRATEVQENVLQSIPHNLEDTFEN